jgi:type II secretory pathway component PulM
MNAIKVWWSTLAPREQRWVGVAAAVVGIALLWLIAIAPALQILRKASAQHAAADLQLEAMRSQAKQTNLGQRCHSNRQRHPRKHHAQSCQCRCTGHLAQPSPYQCARCTH